LFNQEEEEKVAAILIELGFPEFVPIFQGKKKISLFFLCFNDDLLF
jgi:hypothetical protein